MVNDVFSVLTDSYVFSSFPEFVSSLVGGFDTMIMSLIIMLALDYSTAVFRAIYLRKLSSALCLDGVIKKLLCLAVVVLSVVCENLFAGEIPLRELTVFFFILSEGISILENVTDIIPLPDKLKSTLDTILQNTQIIKGKTKENIIEEREKIKENTEESEDIE